MSTTKSSSGSCSSGTCNINKTSKPKANTRNGKGDKPRPFLKNQYDKNYESINWNRK